MAYFTEETILLAKAEAAYGTDPTPTGADDAFRVSNVNLTPLEAEALDQDYVRGYFGSHSQVLTQKFAMVEFGVELTGSGTAGTAPKWGRLAKACGMGETLVANTSATYAPQTSATQDSVTIYVHIGGALFKLTGARGTFALALSPKALPMITFTMTGRYDDPSSPNAPSATLTGFQEPVSIDNANATLNTFHGQTSGLVVSAFEVTLNNTISKRDLPGERVARITDRQAEGSITIDLPDPATFNPVQRAADNSKASMQYTLGTTAGNIIRFDAPNVQLGAPSMADDESIVTAQIPLRFLPDSGNDEFTLRAS